MVSLFVHAAAVVPPTSSILFSCACTAQMILKTTANTLFEHTYQGRARVLWRKRLFTCDDDGTSPHEAALFQLHNAKLLRPWQAELRLHVISSRLRSRGTTPTCARWSGVRALTSPRRRRRPRQRPTTTTTTTAAVRARVTTPSGLSCSLPRAMGPRAAGCAAVDKVMLAAADGLKDPCLAEWEARAMRAL